VWWKFGGFVKLEPRVVVAEEEEGDAE